MKGFERKIKESFYILDHLPEELIIGNEFLFNNDLILDYKNKVVIVENTPIPMIGRENMCKDELDSILYDRLLFIKEKNFTIDSRLERMIKTYFLDNEAFKHIKVDPIELFIKEQIKESNLKLKYYSVPIKYEEGAKQEIKRLLEADIIEENRASFASPSFFIEKKNKELRLVVDYRRVNTFIKDEISLIPKIFESLYRIGRNKVFSKIDLKNGFNQVRLGEKCRD